MEKENTFYYAKFNAGQGYPVYLKFEDETFANQLLSHIPQLGFEMISSEDFDKKPSNHKVLKVVQASPQIVAHLRKNTMSKFGNEKVNPHKNYQVYMYEDKAMMVFSRFYAEWEMGLDLDLTHEDSMPHVQQVMIRFLSQALSFFNVAPFWGVPIEEGAVVMKPEMANGEAFFIDVNRMEIISFDGSAKLHYGFNLLRLDETLRGQSRNLDKEALYSFLVFNTSYLSYAGASAELKETIYKIASLAQGLIYPMENFVPRADHTQVA